MGLQVVVDEDVAFDQSVLSAQHGRRSGSVVDKAVTSSYTERFDGQLLFNPRLALSQSAGSVKRWLMKNLLRVPLPPAGANWGQINGESLLLSSGQGGAWSCPALDPRITAQWSSLLRIAQRTGIDPFHCRPILIPQRSS